MLPVCMKKLVFTKTPRKKGPVGLLVGEIDLRIFYHAWAHGFAVREMTKDGLQRSLQFFDKAGVPFIKFI
jgi:putative hemin transport protein